MTVQAPVMESDKTMTDQDFKQLLQSLDDILKEKSLTPYQILKLIKRFFEDIDVNDAIDGGMFS